MISILCPKRIALAVDAAIVAGAGGSAGNVCIPLCLGTSSYTTHFAANYSGDDDATELALKNACEALGATTYASFDLLLAGNPGLAEVRPGTLNALPQGRALDGKAMTLALALTEP